MVIDALLNGSHVYIFLLLFSVIDLLVVCVHHVFRNVFLSHQGTSDFVFVFTKLGFLSGQELTNYT